VTYLMADALGSVRGSANSSGSLTGTARYDAWGNPQAPGGISAITPFGFAGGYTDPTGLVYLLARYYDPITGQFTSVDPVLRSTHEPYSYAGGNPVTNADPSGRTFSGIGTWGSFCLAGHCFPNGVMWVTVYGYKMRIAYGYMTWVSGVICGESAELRVFWQRSGRNIRRAYSATDPGCWGGEGNIYVGMYHTFRRIYNHAHIEMCIFAGHWARKLGCVGGDLHY